MMPSGVGVQEGAYIVLGAAFGLAPDLALGLSLLKRGRDFLLGIPSLASWHWFENQKAKRRDLVVAKIASAGDS